jgi:hypothetical protein
MENTTSQEIIASCKSQPDIIGVGLYFYRKNYEKIKKVFVGNITYQMFLDRDKTWW